MVERGQRVKNSPIDDVCDISHTLKQHLITENKCDYCEEGIKSGKFYSLTIEKNGKRIIYNGHKNCMRKLEVEFSKEVGDRCV